MSDSHFFQCRLDWTGAESGPAADVQTYSRAHRLSFDGRPSIEASSAPGYLGDPSRLNPEEMLTAAIASCQMLTYLAVMARSRMPVVGYADEAEGVLEKGEDGKIWLTRVTLRPRITLAPGSDVNRAATLVEKAHHHCFIANSVRTKTTILPTFEVASS